MLNKYGRIKCDPSYTQRLFSFFIILSSTDWWIVLNFFFPISLILSLFLYS
ncbi:hypothetical protein LMANV2_470052 [Leptospira interrogans serovar Manilae]|uniref:Uncharacterized protein n=1 Tax=Leptospira interrogans serovar Manilae TaxID=214675 RepID=A0AAQ1P0Y3_LEPIR|nr:hypothetical protein LMANV2_470052 [Leptospira interrogans serovar Manilae]